MNSTNGNSTAPRVPWKGSYIGYFSHIVEHATPCAAERETETVAIQIAPSQATMKMLALAMAAVAEGKSILITNKDGHALDLRAA
jgi:hypothetical protein